MMRTTGKVGLCVVAVGSLFALVGCQGKLGLASAPKKVMLWNGKDFSGWQRFVPDATVDVNDVWRIRNGMLYCTGKPNGYIRTAEKYQDYHLHVEWRWPEQPTNSGVLLHASEPDQLWPQCIECQLKAGSAGDFVLMGGAGLTVDGVDRQDAAKRFVVIGKKASTSEKPAGQWNSYDIHCTGSVVRCYVNGVLQNEGTGATSTSGYICLQSEGGPIEFRNIHILPAD
jgi:hypothetical protein